MRGYQKRVVFLKNIESAMFDEAYFIIKPSYSASDEKKRKETDLINEANRIIEESVGLCNKRKGAIGIKETIIFTLGFLISSIIIMLTVSLIWKLSLIRSLLTILHL